MPMELLRQAMAAVSCEWAQAYGMHSFRFDLMGHQPRAVMVRLPPTQQTPALTGLKYEH